MIIARSPLRITLGGGGTDLPSYHRKHEGFLIAGAIDKYVYVTVMRPFTPGIYLKYSELEHVELVDQVRHRIIREALLMQNLKTPQIEIAALADIPAGTGLGSSGSFTTALLKALYAHRRQLILPGELAELACHIEIDRLAEPIGKQDQYIAAYGGITAFEYLTDDRVEVTPVRIEKETLYNLEDNLVLFFTGYSRSASSILQEQDAKSKKDDEEITSNLHFVKDIGRRSLAALESGDLSAFGELMNVHWEYKKKRSANMTSGKIDEWYSLALKNGAVGGKLIGAGGGGFLMFYTENKMKLRHALMNAGLEEVRFKFDFEGTKVVVQ